MRVLLADHDATLLESMARAARGLCDIDIVRTKVHCLDLLRSNEFDAVIVCDELADGAGLDLLTQVVQRHPSTMRAFAAEPRRLMRFEGRLGPFNLFQTLRYPIAPGELRALLKSVEAAHAANADLTNVQHIVLESEVAEEPHADATHAGSMHVPEPTFLKLELAPDWRPEDAVQPQLPGKPRPPEPPTRIQPAAPRPRTGMQFTQGTPPVPLPLKTGSLNAGGRRVVVVTRDKECLDTAVAALAGRAVAITHATDEDGLAKVLKSPGAIGVLLDLGAGGGATTRMLERVSAMAGDARVLVVGRASDSTLVAPLLAKGTLHRFLVKPLNRAQTRAAFESVLELPKNGSPSPGAKGDVPFASLIDRVSAVDLSESMMRKPSLLKRIALARVRQQHFVVAAGIALAVLAMVGLAYAISS